VGGPGRRIIKGHTGRTRDAPRLSFTENTPPRGSSRRPANMVHEELVSVDMEAIRPVEKRQAKRSQLLDECLAGDDGCRATVRHLAKPLDAFIVSDLLSREESEVLMECARDAGYSFWNPTVVRAEFRNSDTVEITSESVAEELWRRVQPFVVPRVTVERDGRLWEAGVEGEWEAYGINPHLLFNHYSPGGHFSPHTDGATIVDLNHRSLYSMLVYLNHCPEGGGTALFAPPEGTSLCMFVVDGERRYRWPEEWKADVAPVEPCTALVFSQVRRLLPSQRATSRAAVHLQLFVGIAPSCPAALAAAPMPPPSHPMTRPPPVHGCAGVPPAPSVVSVV